MQTRLFRSFCIEIVRLLCKFTCDCLKLNSQVIMYRSKLRSIAQYSLHATIGFRLDSYTSSIVSNQSADLNTGDWFCCQRLAVLVKETTEFQVIASIPAFTRQQTWFARCNRFIGKPFFLNSRLRARFLRSYKSFEIFFQLSH